MDESRSGIMHRISHGANETKMVCFLSPQQDVTVNHIFLHCIAKPFLPLSRFSPQISHGIENLRETIVFSELCSMDNNGNLCHL